MVVSSVSGKIFEITPRPRVRAGSTPATATCSQTQKALTTLTDDQSFLMEAAGVEPASANGSYKASTCVASLSISPGAVSEQPVPKLAT